MLERSENLHIRVTPEEKKTMLSLASAAGMTLTAYLLFCAGLTAGDLLGRQIQEKRQK